MKKIYLTKEFFKDTTNINLSYNSESTLYKKKYELIKLIIPHLRKYKEDTINNLDKIYHKNCANASSIIYDKKGTIGYSMYYFYLYKTIDSLIIDDSIPFDKRIKIVKDLYEVFEYFNKIKFVYDDIHDKNIIYNNDDIKLVDLDCGIFKNKKNKEEYDTKERIRDKRLAKLSLSILYGIPYYKIQRYLENKNLLNSLPDNVKELYKYVINDNYIHFDSSNYVDLLNEELINDTKLILK